MSGRSARLVPGPGAGSRILVTLLALVLIGACSSPGGGGSDDGSPARDSDPVVEAAALEALLRDFLARTEDPSVHDRFWADDLVYTSSDGTRRGKAEIMAGFDSGDDPDEDGESPAPTYSAEDVDIRVYGDVAVVAFRLVITPPDASGEAPSYNLNTGTFVKRDGEWRVVAWQSTRGAG
jgi:ketosteroid isomerase-like protein